MADKAKKIVTVSLEHPIERGETNIATLQLRKPQGGELRGLSIAQLTMLQTDELWTLLPRITIPPLTEAEAVALEPEDLFQCAIEIAGFFLPAGMNPTALTKIQ